MTRRSNPFPVGVLNARTRVRQGRLFVSHVLPAKLRAGTADDPPREGWPGPPAPEACAYQGYTDRPLPRHFAGPKTAAHAPPRARRTAWLARATTTLKSCSPASRHYASSNDTGKERMGREDCTAAPTFTDKNERSYLIPAYAMGDVGSRGGCGTRGASPRPSPHKWTGDKTTPPDCHARGLARAD